MLMIDADDDGGDDDAVDDRDCRVVLSDAKCAVPSDLNPLVPSDPATTKNGHL